MLSACQRLPNLIFWPVLAAGACALLLAAREFPPPPPGLAYLLFALVTLSLGTRFVVKVPRSRDYVAFADAFAVVGLLVFGAGQTVPIAAVASACAALRLTRDARAVLSCAASAALWVTLAGLLVGALAGHSLEGSGAFNVLVALCAVAALRSALAFTFAAAAPAGEHDARRNLTQLSCFLFWAFVTNLAVVSSAGLLAAAAGYFGLHAFLAAATVVSAAHFLYGVYLRNVEASEARGPAPQLFARDAGEVFRSAFEHASIGMGLITPKGRWLKVNRSLCELLGYEEERLLRLSLEDVVHPDDAGQVLAHLKDLLKGTASTYRAERRFLHEQGQAVWLLWSAAPITDEDDSGDVRLIFQAQDITDRKHSE
ncbi:MAG TPA: PAS domain S-box protein, partial [Pyrinomonadaceae bacterium]|nr:PAS domain S-box protein [Pyrinomonadaceae bacterium]